MPRTNFENSSRVPVSRWNWFRRQTIGKQIVEAADSIGANIAEGVGRYGTQDNKRFVYFARDSLYETKHRLRRALREDSYPAQKLPS